MEQGRMLCMHMCVCVWVYAMFMPLPPPPEPQKLPTHVWYMHLHSSKYIRQVDRILPSPMASARADCSWGRACDEWVF